MIGGPLSTCRAAESSVLDLVPRDAVAFVHIRVADIWKTDAFRGVRDFLANDKQTVDEIEARVGFRPADVDSVTLVVPQPDSRQLVAPIVLVRTLAPYDKKKLVAALKAKSLRRVIDQQGPAETPANAVSDARTYL
jgi:hypothetical protein